MGPHPRDETSHRPGRTRVRIPGLEPIELWDLLIEGPAGPGSHAGMEAAGPDAYPPRSSVEPSPADPAILSDRIDDPAFTTLLLEALLRLREGTARVRSSPESLLACRGFDAVWLCGGAVDRLELRDLLTAAPFPVHVERAGPFVGEAGGLELLRRAGRIGMVVDVGQTSIKVSWAGRRLCVPRDRECLPIAPPVFPLEPGASREQPLDRHRERLYDFIAGAMLEALAAGPPQSLPDSVVLALPCELQDDGLPGGSSYGGMKGDHRLVETVLARAGLSASTLFLLNDAELAAVSAMTSPHVDPHRTTLVLTLGFAVGGALLRPAAFLPRPLQGAAPARKL